MRKVTVEMIETFDGQQFKSESLAMQYLSAIYQNALHDIAMELQGANADHIKIWLQTNQAALDDLTAIRKDIAS